MSNLRIKLSFSPKFKMTSDKVIYIVTPHIIWISDLIYSIAHKFKLEKKVRGNDYFRKSNGYGLFIDDYYVMPGYAVRDVLIKDDVVR